MDKASMVLIVDDNPDNLSVLGEVLSRAGYAVRYALSGELALQSLEMGLPDLVLLDVRMPGMDGYETCRQLHARAASRHVPVIFISAMQDTEDKLAGFRAGGVDYVGKPFEEEEVLARVNTHIQLCRMQQNLEQLVQERTLELGRSEARYRALFEDSPMAGIVYDSQNWSILAANVGAARLLGYSRPALIGQSMAIALEPEQRAALGSLARKLSRQKGRKSFAGVFRMRSSQGEVFEAEGVLQGIEYAGHQAQILMLQDISELRHAQERMVQAALEHRQELEKSLNQDALTGLPNRNQLGERMRLGLEQARRSGCLMAVCYLDIDAFQALNKSYGRETGDHLLINTAECLRRCMQPGDSLARIGGDEFVLVLLGRSTLQELDTFLERVQSELAQPFVSDTAVVVLSASIGMSVYPQDDVDPDTLLRHADQAMLQAKQRGPGLFHRFDPDFDKKLRVRQDIVSQMRAALQHDEFVLHYQPKVNLADNSVFGAEALIRWQHPEQGLLYPGAFLPEVEGDPFMLEIGDWVMGQALRQIAHWRAIGLELTVSVNIAAQHLTGEFFVEHLRAQLAGNAIADRRLLELEVLETSALDDMAQVERVIQACAAMGVGFSLDDFGTGYSSLTYLRNLSADTLKIDQTFVRGMLDDPGDRAIVAGVIGLAAAFDRKVIAEGVETAAHAKALSLMGCALVQGYGIARPMPAAEFPGWARGWPHARWVAEMAADEVTLV